METLAICVLSFICVAFGLIIWYLSAEVDAANRILNETLRDLDECESELKATNADLSDLLAETGS